MKGFMVNPLHLGVFKLVAVSFAAGALGLGAGCASTPSQTNTRAASQSQSQPDPSTGAHHSTDSSTAARGDGNQKLSDPAGHSILARSFEEAETRGDAAWGADQADMAIYYYIQALSFRPREISVLGKIGTIEQSRGNLVLAARAFELAANADLNDARLSGRLGLILLALGEEDRAQTWLQRSIESDSTDWRVYDALGVTESHQGHFAAALQYTGEAVTIAPGMALPLLHLGLAKFGDGNYIGAEDAVRSALRISNMPEAWRLLGQIQAKRRAYPASIDSLLQVMDTPAAYNMTGKLALDNGDNAVALHYFENASASSPVYQAEAQRNAAIARARLGALRQ